MHDQDSKYERTASTLSSIGPIAGLIATLIAVFSDLPPIAQNIMLFLLALLTALSAYAVLGKPFMQFLKRIPRNYRDHILSKRHFNRLDKFLDRLAELFEPRKCVNIPYVSNDLQMRYPELRHVSPPLEDFTDLLCVLRTTRTKLCRNKENLRLIISWFESILYVYHKQLVCTPIERIKQLKDGSIPEDIRKRYAEAAAIYQRFIEDYTLFAKEMNLEFQERVAARDYFRMPEALQT